MNVFYLVFFSAMWGIFQEM